MVGRNLRDVLVKDYDVISPSSTELNLLDFKSIQSFLTSERIDCVIHAAGRVGGIQANLKDPTAFLVENLSMGQNLILAAREAGIKKLLNLGSSCMYPREAKNPLTEEQLLTGELEPTNEGYALAKICVAKLCEYIGKENADFHYKTLIPCNLYGFYDSFAPEKSHMIPAVIRKIYEAKVNGQKTVEIWGDGTARREFLFTADFAHFVKFALEKVENLPTYLNVGLGKDFSVKEYYEAISNVVGYEGEFEFNLNRPVGMRQKLVDISKMKHLGWNNQSSINEGLEKTYNYFLEHEV